MYVATNAVHMLDYLAEGVSNLVVLISVGETRKKSNKRRIVTTSVITFRSVCFTSLESYNIPAITIKVKAHS